ncbi:fluoroquinolone transport system permease protein [Caldalkalibacillus uzonensis]|uniref:Fluoroquinolone transport system permease protein n=1 Tax=Caldalkalibacillus uzonensis TaxID=353224 RepID=A0ABU0CRA3_9BACI|nr:hypothetical protein [Caldalkalibacillus uzonensis]MDQ0338025.1 fluoroquinolone transport system permease protein [Caldalkalibacillus uzonensis]
MKPCLQLALADLKNICRDPMLVLALLGSILLAIVFRYVPPMLSEWLELTLGFDLTDYYDLILIIILQLVPLMVGMTSGFMMLDERDEQLIQYFAATPLQKSGYLVVRLGIPFFLTILLCLFVLYFTRLASISAVQLWNLLLLLAFLTPVFALFLAAFAANKVEGLALAKGAGVMIIAPLAVFFLPWQWQVLVSLFPTFWSAKIMFGGDHLFHIMGYSTMGIFVHGAFLWVFYKQFQRRVD